MNDDKRTKEYFDSWRELKLSAASRARMRDELTAYARFHAVKEVPAEPALRPKQSPFMRFFAAPSLAMPFAAFAFVFLAIGGTSLAAAGSLPGDPLYGVKVGFTEPLRAALATTPAERAALAVDHLNERVDEAARLAALGELQGERAVEVRGTVAAYAEAVDAARTGTRASVSVEADSAARLALLRFNELVGADTRYAFNSGRLLAFESGATAASRTTSPTAPAATAATMGLGGGVPPAMGSADVATLKLGAPESLSAPVAGEAAVPLNAIVARERALRALIEGYAPALAGAPVEELLRALDEVRRTGAETAESLRIAEARLAEVEAMLSTYGALTVDPQTGVVTGFAPAPLAPSTSSVPAPSTDESRPLPVEVEGTGSVEIEIAPGAAVEGAARLDSTIETAPEVQLFGF